ncbi:MAG: glycosyltransferase [Actinobacteria bacterium]|nr:MAG: glycosyltransferase [Actinomycetota bacterium]
MRRGDSGRRSPSNRGGPTIGAVRGASASGPAVTAAPAERSHSRPSLTIVVPVYNGGDDVVANVETIRATVVAALPKEEVEVVVVSDGSIDGTAERLLETRGEGVRVIHYDRNLGKGYAVKTGALAAHGEWVALVDADLDLDPASVPRFLAVAQQEQLDFAIGSKRHPESVVDYPRSRRVASWCYQQLNRFLFRLDVRDTQVGLKVFSRRVVEDVMPLLLVKRFAFDVELLAVASALGYDRIRELPVRLDYRFTGSGVGSSAVLFALWDTAAVFYRLRILRTYERKRRLQRRGVAPPPERLETVSVVGLDERASTLDYPRLEYVDRTDAACELVAVVAPEARPAGNWVTAAAPFFSDPEVAAVVAPLVSPLGVPLRQCVAAAVLESRLGGGSRRSSYFPGNVRVVADYPAESVVVRRSDLLAAREAGVEDERLVAWLAERGRRTVYTPDTSIAAAPPPLVVPHLRATLRHARARGAVARRTRGRSLSSATALSLAPAGAGVVGIALLAAGDGTRLAGIVVLLVCGAGLLVSGLHAALRFRSPVVGLLEPPAVVASELTYVYGFVRGFIEG